MGVPILTPAYHPISVMQLLFLLLFVFSRADHKDLNEGCVEIHQWLQWDFIKFSEEACSYWCGKICETITEEVCIQVPITNCELVGYAKCTDQKEVLQMRNDTFVTEDFQVITCSPGPEVEFTGIKQVVNCVDRIQENCDTKWETDPVTKEKVWVGNVNCREVTVPDCTLEDKEVVELVQTTDCKVTNTIQYQDRAVVTVDVPIITSKCEPKISSVCFTTSENVCTTVTWDQCTDSIVPWCQTFDVFNPHQEEDHRLRCPHDYTTVDTTSIKPIGTTNTKPITTTSIQPTTTSTTSNSQTTATTTIKSWIGIGNWTGRENCTETTTSNVWQCVYATSTPSPPQLVSTGSTSSQSSWQSVSAGSVSSHSVSSESTALQSSSHSSSHSVSSESVSSQSSLQSISSDSESSQATNIFLETMDSIFGK